MSQYTKTYNPMAIMIQRSFDFRPDPAIECWCVTFPSLETMGITREKKPMIIDSRHYPTYMKAYQVAKRWKKRLDKLTNKRLPLVCNDLKYAWLDSPKHELRYQVIEAV